MLMNFLCQLHGDSKHLVRRIYTFELVTNSWVPAISAGLHLFWLFLLVIMLPRQWSALGLTVASSSSLQMSCFHNSKSMSVLGSQFCWNTSTQNAGYAYSGHHYNKLWYGTFWTPIALEGLYKSEVECCPTKSSGFFTAPLHVLTSIYHCESFFEPYIYIYIYIYLYILTLTLAYECLCVVLVHSYLWTTWHVATILFLKHGGGGWFHFRSQPMYASTGKGVWWPCHVVKSVFFERIWTNQCRLNGKQVSGK